MDDFIEKLGKFLRIGFIVWISLLIILLTIIFSMFVSHSCNGRSDNEQDIKVYGDFIYKVVYYNEDGIEIVVEKNSVRSAIRIMGLSEEGMKKESVIIPEYIDELKVEELGKSIEFWGIKGIWEENEILKKVFVRHSLDINPVFSNCKNLNRVIFNKHYSDTHPGGKPAYVTSYHYDSEEDVINCYRNGGYGYVYFANVSYFYNYDNAPNDNYYWIDDYDYGEKIDFIPPVPTRAGYTFGGWYKESECINKWDFEIDRLPEVKYTDVIPTHQLYHHENYDNDYRIYQETKLYAKWI